MGQRGRWGFCVKRCHLSNWHRKLESVPSFAVPKKSVCMQPYQNSECCFHVFMFRGNHISKKHRSKYFQTLYLSHLDTNTRQVWQMESWSTRLVLGPKHAPFLGLNAHLANVSVFHAPTGVGGRNETKQGGRSAQVWAGSKGRGK